MSGVAFKNNYHAVGDLPGATQQLSAAGWQAERGRGGEGGKERGRERTRGDRTSTIARHGAPEPHMVDELLPGIRRLSRTRVKWKGRTGASATRYGGRMSPANPRYVGRGDSTCGGEVVYTILEIRTLICSQPEDAQSCLTTSQMEWAFTREGNEMTNEKNERGGKPVARQLAPMISKFSRAQWESHELECMDDERRRSLKRKRSLITHGVCWRWQRRPTTLKSGLSNHPGAQMT